MKYIEEAIDIGSEYGMKYLELVSKSDYGDNLEVHHIVPVAYFADVLGIKECRTSKSPDMAKENLVSISRGHHVLAHFYLAKCARKCIAVQMRNAFCLTFQTTDFSSVTEEDVLSRIDEIDREYRKMKSMKKEHKDGIEIRRTKTCVSMNKWEDGKPVGISMKWGADGTIREVEDHETGFNLEVNMGTDTSRVRIHWKIGTKDIGIDLCDTHFISVFYGNLCVEACAHRSYGSFSGSVSWRKFGWKNLRGEDFWEQIKDFLSKSGRECLSTIILSIRQYMSMVKFRMDSSTNLLLRYLEDCAVDAKRLPTFKLPAFPEAA